VADVADPLGGSWAIERLTDELEAEARDLIAAVDKVGGVLAAIEAGYIQQKIQESAYEYQREVEEGKRLVVGVNIHKPDARAKVQSTVHDPATERERVERLRRWKAARAVDRAPAAVRAIEDAARGTANLVDPIVAAVEAGASLGEVAHALRRVFGEYQDPTV
jgi:methylmalonyl-CoA mutase N-terminal domain/subunit